MGIVEAGNRTLTIVSHIITYGNAADPALTEMMRKRLKPCGINLRGGY
jgi:hypothetical protein